MVYEIAIREETEFGSVIYGVEEKIQSRAEKEIVDSRSDGTVNG